MRHFRPANTSTRARSRTGRFPADTGPGTEAGAYSVSTRLPAPGGVTGGLSSDGKVMFTFSRVPGAVAYRTFRNGQALQWASDWGQASFLVTDASPCQNANYQVYAMKPEDNSPASLGQISTSFRLNASDKLAAFALAKGTTFTYRVSSYNDLAHCARLQRRLVDVWLPGGQAANWGIQRLSLVVE